MLAIVVEGVVRQAPVGVATVFERSQLVSADAAPTRCDDAELECAAGRRCTGRKPPDLSPWMEEEESPEDERGIASQSLEKSQR